MELVVSMYNYYMYHSDELVISYHLYAGTICALCSAIVYIVCYDKFNFKETSF